MSNGNLTCENCGANLPSEDAICAACEKILEEQVAAENQTNGKYRCPSCSGRFNHPGMGNWPPNVPWYRPQSPNEICPRCGIFLEDTLVRKASKAEKAAAAVFLVFSALLPDPYRKIMAIAIALFLVYPAVLEYKRFRERRLLESMENRYEIKRMDS